jgi:HAE1 family hydrophobic/amphiphilic exporter-1
MRLKLRDQRNSCADEIIQRLKPKLAVVFGISMFIQNLLAIRVGGQLSKSKYKYTLQSPNKDLLYRKAVESEEKMNALPQLQEVPSDL